MKRGQHHGALRQLLIDTALGLLDRDGVEAVTIRAVARASGVSHAAPANHFADRRALLTALAVQCFIDLRTGASAARAAASPSPRARIIAFADAYVAYALAHPNRYRMMWRMDMLDPGDRALADLVDGLYAGVEEDVRALRGKDAHNAGDATTLLIALSSVVHGYVAMRIDGNFVAAIDETSGKPRHEAIIEQMIGQ
ncbi:TetR/AcrR family transcriptional regulator [Sphingopyxis sp. L1A2A]|uniref:TetR/AcrR family transcriptional regulator n=1 Tax=Sphingopyxis sp. L1A2A TaxID=2502247 RepID=UPI0010F6A627|nr:TetR/AcrR family transcriptional regulator [Sphingopyxis sp. L1A2A]